MSLSNKLGVGFLLSGLALTSCDTSGNVELAKTKYEGPVTVRLVQRIQYMGEDDYFLEVQDSTGVVIAYMESVGKKPQSQLKVHGKMYDLRDKGFRVEE